MSDIIKIINDNLKALKKSMVYALAEGNTICDFCLMIQQEYKESLNDLQKMKLKKCIKKLNLITNTFRKLTK